MLIETFRDREEWLAARRNPTFLGASEAALALGVSPYGTAWDLFARKRERAVEGRVAEPLQRGHRWEPAVLAEYADASGHRVVTPGEFVGHPEAGFVTLANDETPWLRESPDAFATDRTGAAGQVEAKTAVRAHAWTPEQGLVIEAWDDRHAEHVPAHYAVQGYVQLAVTGLPWVDLCALVPGGGWLHVRWVRLLRDIATQGQMVAALAEWRQRHLVAGVPPEIDGSAACNRHLARSFQRADPRPSRIATAQEREDLTRLAKIRADSKRLDEMGKTLANQLTAGADGHRLYLDPPDPAAKRAPFAQPQHNKGRASVDLDALRAEAPELVARHTRAGEPFVTFNLYGFDKEQ